VALGAVGEVAIEVRALALDLLLEERVEDCQFRTSASRTVPLGTMSIARWRTSLLLFAGHTSTQSPHPVQSSGETCSV